MGAEVGRQVGGTFANGTNLPFDTPVAMRDTSLKGFWLGTQLTPDWGLELSVRRSSTLLYQPDSSVWTAQTRGAWFEYADMELAAMRRWRSGPFEPYALAGAGMANLNINLADPGYRDTNRFSLGAGGGLRWWAAPWLALRIDARAHAAYLQVRTGGADRGALDPGRWLRTGELTAGLQVSFGTR